MNLIHPDIAANECKPVAIGHRPELVLVLNEAVVIEFVLIEGALLVKPHFVVWTEFVQRDNTLLASLYFAFPRDPPFKRGDEEAIGTFHDL